MRSRVNRFNYSNGTGGQCNNAGGKKREENLALCTAGGKIYAWLDLWRHKCAKKLLHNFGQSDDIIVFVLSPHNK